jgi:hypothetical protein
MINGEILFQGTSLISQLKKIMQIRGTPSVDNIELYRTYPKWKVIFLN